MGRGSGLRERKKAQTRQHIADTAAHLFAAHGYDAVSVVDVAREAEVSDQTVYNYFPAKQDLVLDRAEQFREWYRRLVVERPAGTTPAEALRVAARADVERHRHSDPRESRGQYPALCVGSAGIRRFALEMREQQAEAVARALVETCAGLHPAVARAHAGAFVAAFQMITDRIGRGVLDETPPTVVADGLTPVVEIVFDDLDAHFQHAHHPDDAVARGLGKDHRP